MKNKSKLSVIALGTLAISMTGCEFNISTDSTDSSKIKPMAEIKEVKKLNLTAEQLEEAGKQMAKGINAISIGVKKYLIEEENDLAKFNEGYDWNKEGMYIPTDITKDWKITYHDFFERVEVVPINEHILSLSNKVQVRIYKSKCKIIYASSSGTGQKTINTVYCDLKIPKKKK